VKKIHRARREREQRSEDEQNVKILAAVKFLYDDASESKNFVHDAGLG
jgi:hypothetical protein